ncbi:UNVERIFIED_CONTAM: hypothetical protein FKN15_029716, partial [Acipenser sinensis]
YMAHDRYGLWKMGIPHVLNAAHEKMCCKGSPDFYVTTVDYHGVPASDLPDFDLSQYFYLSAINSPGDAMKSSRESRNRHLSVKALENILDSCKVELTQIDEVWPNLYIGNVAIAQDRSALQRMGITHVLNATHSKQGSLGNQSFYGKKIQYYGIAAEDSSEFDLSIYFKAAAQFIHKGLKKKDGSCVKAQSRRLPVTNNTVSSAIKSQSECITPSLQDLQHLLWTQRGSSGHVDQVWPRIYLGDKYAARDKRTLLNLGITHIVNAAQGIYQVNTRAKYYRDMQMHYLGVEADDEPEFDMSPFFYPTAKFISAGLGSLQGNCVCTALTKCSSMAPQ